MDNSWQNMSGPILGYIHIPDSGLGCSLMADRAEKVETALPRAALILASAAQLELVHQSSHRHVLEGAKMLVVPVPVPVLILVQADSGSHRE